MPRKNVRPYTLYPRIFLYLYGELVLKNVMISYVYPRKNVVFIWKESCAVFVP